MNISDILREAELEQRVRDTEKAFLSIHAGNVTPGEVLCTGTRDVSLDGVHHVWRLLMAPARQSSSVQLMQAAAILWSYLLPIELIEAEEAMDERTLIRLRQEVETVLGDKWKDLSRIVANLST